METKSVDDVPPSPDRPYSRSNQSSAREGAEDTGMDIGILLSEHALHQGSDDGYLGQLFDANIHEEPGGSHPSGNLKQLPVSPLDGNATLLDGQHILQPSVVSEPAINSTSEPSHRPELTRTVSRLSFLRPHPDDLQAGIASDQSRNPLEAPASSPHEVKKAQDGQADGATDGAEDKDPQNNSPGSDAQQCHDLLVGPREGKCGCCPRICQCLKWLKRTFKGGHPGTNGAVVGDERPLQGSGDGTKQRGWTLISRAVTKLLPLNARKK